jgi:hypothetical protein
MGEALMNCAAPIGVRGIVAAVVFGPLLFAACKSGGPSKDELNRLIDERLAERGLAPLPSASAVASSAPAAASGKSPSNDPASVSLALLARLDDLMKDYVSTPTTSTDETDVLRCTTADELASNTDLGKVVGSAKAKRRQAAADLDRNPWVQYRVDYDWKNRRDKWPTKYGCWDNDSHDWWTEDRTDLNCYSKLNREPRPRAFREVFMYSRQDVSHADAALPPELMKRMGDVGLKLDERFSCLLADVTPSKPGKVVLCAGTKPAGVSLRLSGNTASQLHVGDLVSVPFRDTNREPDGVLSKAGTALGRAAWVVDADGSALRVDAAAKCPTVEEIVSALTPKK